MAHRLSPQKNRKYPVCAARLGGNGDAGSRSLHRPRGHDQKPLYRRILPDGGDVVSGMHHRAGLGGTHSQDRSESTSAHVLDFSSKSGDKYGIQEPALLRVNGERCCETE